MLEGVKTPEQAKSWKGQEVFINKEELKTLPPGEYYHADLVNLSVLTMAGERIGNITGINNFGAGDVIEIELDKPQKGLRKTLLVPFRGEVIKDIDLTKRVLIIDPEGWLEV
ncbi:MAG: 16S rRNA processing protein RimM [Proteobacteria bacterium]|nr:16S rRNA processing protein RimM [Pseudomonadota bacterium]